MIPDSLPGERVVATHLVLLEIAVADALTDGPAVLLIESAARPTSAVQAATVMLRPARLAR